MALIKYTDVVTNTRGDSLPDYRVQVVTSAGAEVEIYSDGSGTRFRDAAGNVVNYATASSTGKIEFYWTPATGQILQTLDTGGNLVDTDADFADKFVVANLAGELPQDQVTNLPADLASLNSAVAGKAATTDLVSNESGKGLDLLGEPTVEQMLATSAPARGAGSKWNAGGFRYIEAASGATDHHLTTASGVKLYVQPVNGCFVDTAFGVKNDNVTDDADAWERAFKACGRNGAEVRKTPGVSYLSRPIEISQAKLGFVWRNISLQGVLNGSYVDDGWHSCGFRTNGTSAIRIFVDGYGHEEVRIKELAFDNGGTKAGTSAIEFYMDPARSFNYPNGWIIEHIGAKGFENVVYFNHDGAWADPSSYFGRTEISHLYCINCDNSIHLDAVYANLFETSQWRCKNGGAVKFTNGSGGFLYMRSLHQEDAPVCFDIGNNSRNIVISLHDFDGEENDKLVELNSTQTKNPEFVFTGFARIPFGLKTEPEVVGRVAISAYTNLPIYIHPRGTLIRTPANVKIGINPDATGTVNDDRLGWFFVPRAEGLSSVPKVCPQPIAGMRSSGGTGPGAKSSAGVPLLEATESHVYRSSVVADNPLSRDVFAVAWSMGMTAGSTRIDNPIAWVIDGVVENTYFSAEFLTGEHTCVVFWDVRSGETFDGATIAPTNVNTDYPLCVGQGFWVNAGDVATEFLPCVSHTQAFTETVADAASAVIRVTSDNSIGAFAVVTLKVDNGSLGAAQVILHGTTGASGTKAQTEVYKVEGTGITITPGAGNNPDFGVVTVANATGSSVLVEAEIRYF